MPTTPIYLLPYPAAADPADVPLDMQELADRIEAVLPTLSGAMMLSDKLLASPAATIDFTAIPGTYRQLRVVAQLRGDAAAAAVVANLRFNADAGANYDWQASSQSGTTALVGVEGLAQTSARVGAIPGGSAPAAAAGPVVIEIPNYAATTFQKTARSMAGLKSSVAAGGIGTEDAAQFWRNTAAITQVNLLLSSGSFAVGSRATLYGLA